MNSNSTNDIKYIFQGKHQNKLWFSDYKDTKLKIFENNPKYITPFVPDNQTDFFCIWEVYFGDRFLRNFKNIQDAIDYQNKEALNIVTELFLNVNGLLIGGLHKLNFTESPQFYFDQFCFKRYNIDPKKYKYFEENAMMYPKVLEKFGYFIGFIEESIPTMFRSTPQQILKNNFNATDDDIKQFNNRIHITFERLDKEERFDEMLQLLNSEEYSQFLRNYIINSNGMLIPNIIKKGKINIQNL